MISPVRHFLSVIIFISFILYHSSLSSKSSSFKKQKCLTVSLFKIISLHHAYAPLPFSPLHCLSFVFCLLGWKCLFKIISLHPDYSPLPSSSASAGSPVPSLAPPRHRDFQANATKIRNKYKRTKKQIQLHIKQIQNFTCPSF